MISYDLAKKLKDAGFPQAKGNGEFLSETGAKKGNEAFQWVYAPTLEELIDACSNGLEEKRSITIQWYPVLKKAFANVYMTEIVQGSTPSEAVANLYLVLYPLQKPNTS